MAATTSGLRLKDPVSGLTHLGGFLASLLAGGVLIGATRGALSAQLVSVVFTVCMAAVYLASSAYHLVVTTAERQHKLHILDRAAIFLMIAGTSTPYFYYGYEEPTRTTMLTLIWVLAFAGVGFKLLWAHAPRWLFVILYLAMGWVAVLRYDETIHGLPPDVFAFLLAGGLAYTAGAVVYAVKRPNLSASFGFHEIWHCFVLAGTALHYVGIYKLAT
jgi:hemolysin III